MINIILDLLKTKLWEVTYVKEILFINKEPEQTPQVIIQWDTSSENQIQSLISNMTSFFKLTVRMPFVNEEEDVLFFNWLISDIVEKLNTNKTLDNTVENIIITSIEPDNNDDWSKKRVYTISLEISYKVNISE